MTASCVTVVPVPVDAAFEDEPMSDGVESTRMTASCVTAVPVPVDAAFEDEPMSFIPELFFLRSCV